MILGRRYAANALVADGWPGDVSVDAASPPRAHITAGPSRDHGPPRCGVPRKSSLAECPASVCRRPGDGTTRFAIGMWPVVLAERLFCDTYFGQREPQCS